MKNIKNKVVAITGASSGIGQMLAVNFAKKGCHLALASRNETKLQETINLIKDPVNITTHILDVANRKQVFLFAEEVIKQHNHVDIIINNAGVSLIDLLYKVSLEDFEWIMNINFWGVVYGTMAFLPYLKKRPESHIINVSSVYGLLPVSNAGCYCASKFAIRGYTESLIQEMRGTSTHVSCVYPGGIKTDIVKNAKINNIVYGMPHDKARKIFQESLLKTSSDKAAKQIISGIQHNKSRILVGSFSKTTDILMRIMPITIPILIDIINKRIAKIVSSRGEKV